MFVKHVFNINCSVLNIKSTSTIIIFWGENFKIITIIVKNYCHKILVGN